MGDTVKEIGQAVAGTVSPAYGLMSGKGGFGKLQNTLMGKKDPGTPDEVIDLADPEGRSLQNNALGKFGNVLNQDTNALAKSQTMKLENQARAGVADQERMAKQLVAQRGLGNSSVGVNAVLNQSAGLGKEIGNIRANQPLLANQLNNQNLQFASGGINQILNEQGQSKILKMGQASKGRQGGLLPLIGAGAGAYFGGPQGAQMGMAAGQAATQIG